MPASCDDPLVVQEVQRFAPLALRRFRGDTMIAATAVSSPSNSGRLCPGCIVRARGREWLVVAVSEGEILQVRPTSGSEEDATVIHLALETEPVLPGPCPEPTETAAPQAATTDCEETSTCAAQAGFEALSIEGGLFSPEWLSKVAELTAGMQAEADYEIPASLNLREGIARSWHAAQVLWEEFARGLGSQGLLGSAGSDGTEYLERSERFIGFLLRESLGFTSLVRSDAVAMADRTYPIRWGALDGRVPVVVASPGLGLDTLSPSFGDGADQRSACGLAQEYLNARGSTAWGIATDATTLRILRNNATLARPAWLEADLRRIFSEKLYPEFAALWLLAHETRFGRKDAPTAECVLEAWRNADREQGVRAREQLRKGVEEALSILGRGFLAHPHNQALRSELQNGSLSTKEYFHQLLRLVYRLILLLTVEERNLLHTDDSPEQAKALYSRGYGMRRLGERAVRGRLNDQFWDLWEAAKIVFRALATGEPRLGLAALSGIFAPDQCKSLDTAKLENRSLLPVMYKLAWLRQEHGLARVNWRDMGPEELGSVYEGLLELVPQFQTDGWLFTLAAGGESKGNARRRTGSYYTPDALVQTVLDSALEPVIAETRASHPSDPASGLLELSIADPACGSGHFLLAAARRLAMHVAGIQANGTPSANAYRQALHRVVSRCIYGVDLNPMAVELCRVSLWLEAVEPGLPLNFLDTHIQHGNALLGTTPEQMQNGIPDAAWDPVEGDDRTTAYVLKKRNRRDTSKRRAQPPEAPPPSWVGVLGSAEYQHQKLVADAWCAAFLWPKHRGPFAEAAPTNDVWTELRNSPNRHAPIDDVVEELAEQYGFFHWHLQFPHVFAKGGFDVVLGNPPWIAHAGRASQPLPPAIKQFYEINYEAFANYPTTHGLFAGVIPQILRIGGRLGLVIPSSVSDLDGYAATRMAHDRLCEFSDELVDFGEGRFSGVTQPCMALTSRRVPGGRGDDCGQPWPVARPDLSAGDRQLLAHLASLPRVPAELFGERGVQSDRTLLEHFEASSSPVGRFTMPIREGTDVREFELLPPRYHVDPRALGGRMRSPEEFRAVRIVIRQTARYPIAAVSDGIAFRNSLVAGFELPGWPADALVALLNSALVRWAHYMRFRDARQPVMPQVKIGHLRAIPVPSLSIGAWVERLAAMGRELSGIAAKLASAPREATPRTGEMLDSSQQGARQELDAARQQLDLVVADLYGLGAQEQATVRLWHDRMRTAAQSSRSSKARRRR